MPDAQPTTGAYLSQPAHNMLGMETLQAVGISNKTCQGDCPYQRSEICPFPFQTLTPNHFRPFNYFPSLPSWPLILKVRDSSTGRFEILNLGFWNLGLCFFLTSYILEFGFLMLDFYILEFWILGFWDDVEFKFGIFGFGSFFCFNIFFWSFDFGVWILDFGVWVWEFGFCFYDPRNY